MKDGLVVWISQFLKVRARVIEKFLYNFIPAFIFAPLIFYYGYIHSEIVLQLIALVVFLVDFYHFVRKWCSRRDLNSWPLHYQCSALPYWATQAWVLVFWFVFKNCYFIIYRHIFKPYSQSDIYRLRACSSVWLEHEAFNLGVAGSNPVRPV